MRLAVFLTAAMFTVNAAVDQTFCNNGNNSGWSNEDQNEYIAKMIWGAVVGIVIGLVCVILMSLPLCCGICKGPAKPLAGIVVFLGLLACAMPYIGNLTADCKTFIDSLCNDCQWSGDDCTKVLCEGCDPTFSQALDDNCNLVGFIVAYAAWGWAAVVLGLTSIGLACCVFCGCCKMKDEAAATGSTYA